MYSPKIRKILKKAKIRIGDRISVEKSGKRYVGLLMPKTEFSDPNTLIIKLDNGYNIGLDIEKAKISKEKSREPSEIKAEEEFELGKIKKGLLKVKFDAKKPKVSLISVGGTISSRVDYRTGGVYALKNPKEILHNVPELANIVNLKMLNPFNKMSEDMDSEDWKKIARFVAKELNSGKRGVVITHGTDTLHFTSAALSFFLRGLSKPVVLTGAQRSSDRGSSDAGMNLICSSHVATSDIAEVGICMHASQNDNYCSFMRGTKVRKLHTSRRDAFRPVNEIPLARVFPDGKIEITNRNYKKRKDTDVELDTKFQPKIALLKVYPGADPEVIDYYVSKGYKGFVIEGTGLGHVPTFARKSWTEKIKEYSKDGIPFVVTAQTIFGRVNPYVYTNLRILFVESRAIPGEDMLSEVAYVKLGWVLGHTKDSEKIRKMMLTNYAGEITSRSEIKAFSLEGLNE
jgi:glutamyl-tRNA(Gln) amidotransferase subunit D